MLEVGELNPVDSTYLLMIRFVDAMMVNPRKSCAALSDPPLVMAILYSNHERSPLTRS